MSVPGEDRTREINVFYRYITGKNPSAVLAARYLQAIAAFPGKGSPREKKILAFVIRNSWALGMIDGAVAFSAPRSLLRQRLLIMTALAETEPGNAPLFLPRDRPFMYVFVIGLRLWWGAIKLVSGNV